MLGSLTRRPHLVPIHMVCATGPQARRLLWQRGGGELDALSLVVRHSPDEAAERGKSYHSAEFRGIFYGRTAPFSRRSCRVHRPKRRLTRRFGSFFLSFRRTSPVVATHSPHSVLRWGWSSSQSVDQPQDLLEQFSRHRDLGHLEDGVPGMAHDLGADLDQLLPQAGQRPLRDGLG